MSLFKTEAHNLVLVGDSFNTTTAPAANANLLAKGVFGLYTEQGVAIDPDAAVVFPKIRLALGTAKAGTPIGGTATLPLISEPFGKDNVVDIRFRAYAAPVQQVTTVTVTSATAGEHVIATEFSDWGALSAQNYHSIYATYVAAAGATVTDIAAGLVAVGGHLNVGGQQAIGRGRLVLLLTTIRTLNVQEHLL